MDCNLQNVVSKILFGLVTNLFLLFSRIYTGELYLRVVKFH